MLQAGRLTSGQGCKTHYIIFAGGRTAEVWPVTHPRNLRRKRELGLEPASNDSLPLGATTIYIGGPRYAAAGPEAELFASIVLAVEAAF